MVKLFNEDCSDGLSRIPDGFIDCVITDPPYNLGLMSQSRGYHVQSMRKNNFVTSTWDNANPETWRKLMRLVIRNLSRKLKVGGNLVIFASFLKIHDIYEAAIDYGFYYKTVGVYHKTNPMPRNMNLHFVNSNEAWLYFVNQKRTGTFNNNGKLIPDFFECSIPSTKEREGIKHPTQKPLSIIKPLVEILSNKGDTVLDCFLGSGTTAVAAIETGRNFIGFEIDSEYFNAAQSRVQNHLKGAEQ